MTDAHRREPGFLARLVIALALGLVAAGVRRHGMAAATLACLWRNLVEAPV